MFLLVDIRPPEGDSSAGLPYAPGPGKLALNRRRMASASTPLLRVINPPASELRNVLVLFKNMGVVLPYCWHDGSADAFLMIQSISDLEFEVANLGADELTDPLPILTMSERKRSALPGAMMCRRQSILFMHSPLSVEEHDHIRAKMTRAIPANIICAWPWRTGLPGGRLRHQG